MMSKIDTRKGKNVKRVARIDGKDCEIVVRSIITIYSCGRQRPFEKFSLYEKILSNTKKYVDLRTVSDINNTNSINTELINEIVYNILYYGNELINEKDEIKDVKYVDVEFKGFDHGIDVFEEDIELTPESFNAMIFALINALTKRMAKAIWGISNETYIANIFLETNRVIYYPSYDGVSNELFIALYYNIIDKRLDMYIQRVALLEVSNMAYTCKRDRLNCVFYRYP